MESTTESTGLVAAAAAAAAAAAPPAPAPSSYGCKHYRRKCELLSPCCNSYYTCRLCHDEIKYDAVLDPKKNPHRVNRHAVTRVKCLVCKLEQPSQQNCSGCGVVMGEYFCSICNFFDDTARGQWHCEVCEATDLRDS